MSHKIKIIEKQTVYNGFFQLLRYRLQHTLFQGGWSGILNREVLHNRHAAAVLLYDPQREEVVLIEQFRAGALNDENAWLIEIVAGLLEEGETPEELVKREALEEAGCTILDLVPIHTIYASPGGMSEKISLFCGRVDTTDVGGFHGVSEEDEDIKVHVFSVEQAFDMLHQGQILVSHSIIALQWLMLNREKLKLQWQ